MRFLFLAVLVLCALLSVNKWLKTLIFFYIIENLSLSVDYEPATDKTAVKSTVPALFVISHV